MEIATKKGGEMLKAVLRFVLRFTPQHELNVPGERYLADFLPQVKRLAWELSEPGKPVSACYDKRRRHVEFRLPDGKSLGQLAIHGECCHATTAWVSPTTLNETMGAHFKYHLKKLDVQFIELCNRPGILASA